MRSGNIAGAWSPDSKWLAYSKVLPNELSAIHLYSLADGKSTQVTDGMSDATIPCSTRTASISTSRRAPIPGKAWVWIFTRWSAPRPVRFTWRFWTRRSLRRLLRKATKKKPLTRRSPPRARKAIRDPTRPRRTPEAGRSGEAEGGRSERQDRSGRDRSADPVRADAAAAVHGAAGGEGGNSSGAGSGAAGFGWSGRRIRPGRSSTGTI